MELPTLGNYVVDANEFGRPLDTVKGAMDPSTLAFINAGANVLGKALTPSPQQSSAAASGYSNVDHSGWSVSFGGNASTAAGVSPWVLLGVAVLALVALKIAKQ